MKVAGTMAKPAVHVGLIRNEARVDSVPGHFIVSKYFDFIYNKIWLYRIYIFLFVILFFLFIIIFMEKNMFIINLLRF